MMYFYLKYFLFGETRSRPQHTPTSTTIYTTHHQHHNLPWPTIHIALSFYMQIFLKAIHHSILIYKHMWIPKSVKAKNQLKPKLHQISYDIKQNNGRNINKLLAERIKADNIWMYMFFDYMKHFQSILTKQQTKKEKKITNNQIWRNMHSFLQDIYVSSKRINNQSSSTELHMQQEISIFDDIIVCHCCRSLMILNRSIGDG